MQQKCSAIYLLLLLSLGSWQHKPHAAHAQAVSSSSSPAPSSEPGGSITSSPAPVGSPTPGISTGVTSSPASGSNASGTSPTGTPAATSPAPGSTATGSSSPAPGSTAPRAGTAPGSSPAPGPDVGWVMPLPDETAIDGIKSRDDCTLTSALFGAMGAKASTACSGSSNGKTQSFNEFTGSTQRSSSSNRGGFVRTSVGAQFCISHEAASALAAEANKLSFSSTGSVQRELPDIYDPSCDDPDAVHREGCPEPPPTASFFEDTSSDGASPSPNPVGVSPSPDGNPLADCTRKFLRVGSTPRSLAIILLKWDRKYYKTKEECCQEQGNPPNCDCNWSGYTWDNLPPPKAYSRYFTDECDLGPSMNRGYYDMSGGKVTFHSKLRVPTPQGAPIEPPTDVSSSSSDVSPSPDLANPQSQVTPPPPVTPPPRQQPNVVPSQPIETANSYQDPDGVDVYGWATLPDMRTEAGLCKDWCGDAMRQLNVTDTDYNHIICLQLLASKAICDVCTGGDCIGTCSASTGITTGCGCATCYYAWGGQAGCNSPSYPGIRVGMGANSKTYDGDMLVNTGGPFISVTEQLKRYVAHELGHNMGLTHTGSVNCKVDGDSNILRDPQQCRPDWYGDPTSFMGAGGLMSVPNALRYKERWLPRNTIRTHPQGEEQQYTLWASTTRRPSWQAEGEPVRWFTRTITLTVRVQLRNPPGSKQDVTSYTCPCTGNGACPSCTKDNPSACDNGSCCMDDSCADDGLNWLYIELHQPYKNDYEANAGGLAIRMMSDLTNCTSTRMVQTYASGGQANYLLTKPDPTGATPGSKYEDLFRGVRVVLESWHRTRATIRVWSA